MSLRKKIGLGVGTLALVLLALGYTRFYVPTRFAVDIGAGMLAKQVCSCVYIAGRSVEDCRADEMAALDPIELEVLDPPGRVRASVPFFGERTALHRPGLGCALE